MVDLLKIDWQHDDGVNIPMINDFLRNQFYDNILKDTVQDRVCLEIGFGTGILSLLALKHGAKHIIAYESDSLRYQLGLEIIKQLGYSNSITLINGRYTADTLTTHPEVELIFTETIDGRLWGESLWKSFPHDADVEFIPGQYFLNVYAVPISKEMAKGLLTTNGDRIEFNPGVDVDENFIRLINQYLVSSYGNQASGVTTVELKSGITEIKQQHNPIWFHMPQMKLLDSLEPIVGYTVDLAKKKVIAHDSVSVQELDLDSTDITLTVDTREWVDSIMLLIPRVGTQHGKHQMFLDKGTWGALSPMLVIDANKNIKINHSFETGFIGYNFNE